MISNDTTRRKNNMTMNIEQDVKISLLITNFALQINESTDSGKAK